MAAWNDLLGLAPTVLEGLLSPGLTSEEHASLTGFGPLENLDVERIRLAGDSVGVWTYRRQGEKKPAALIVGAHQGKLWQPLWLIPGPMAYAEADTKSREELNQLLNAVEPIKVATAVVAAAAKLGR